MKELIKYMDSLATARIELPAEKIDLVKWFTEITDADYRSYSTSHLAMGISKIDAKQNVYINVERSGKSILVHHYVPEYMHKNRVMLVSADSMALAGSRTFIVRVTWELSIKPVNNTSCELINKTTVSTDNKIVAWLGKLADSKRINTHNQDETVLFAKGIEKKFMLKIL